MKASLISIALMFAVLAAPVALAQDPGEEPGQQHCPLPTSWECIKEYGDMVLEDDDGVLIWACTFISGQDCGYHNYKPNYICMALTGSPCTEDQG